MDTLTTSPSASEAFSTIVPYQHQPLPSNNNPNRPIASLEILFANLPVELRDFIRIFTFLFQMQDTLSTKDPQVMARRVCAYNENDSETLACWVTTLTDIGMHIPYPTRIYYTRSNVQMILDPTWIHWTVFHCAANAGNIPLIRRLVHLGYDINAPDSTGSPALLHVVSSFGHPSKKLLRHLAVLQALCEHGANVNIGCNGTDPYVLSMLIRGCTCPHDDFLRAAEALIKHGASLNGALHAAARCNSGALFVNLLLEAGADPEEVIDGNMTPLTYAAWYKNFNVAKALIDAGAKINLAALRSPLFAETEFRNAVSTVLCCAEAVQKRGNLAIWRMGLWLFHK